MSNSPRILAFAGSVRKDSYNKKLLAVAVQAARNAGLEVTHIDLADYPLPLYNADLEAADGMPDNAGKLKTLFLAHQGLLIASPEYNSSFTPLLKNTIDWLSRPASDNEPMLAPFLGKIAGLMAASPGALGGLRGLVPLRMLLENISVTVIPRQVAIVKAHEAFQADGSFKDPHHQQAVGALATDLVYWLQKVYAV